MIKSQKTGNFYAQTMKTNIIASMDFDTCKMMVGEKVPGTIGKKNCPPYQYTTPDGSKKTLNYTYVYLEIEESDEGVDQHELVA